MMLMLAEKYAWHGTFLSKLEGTKHRFLYVFIKHGQHVTLSINIESDIKHEEIMDDINFSSL